MGARRRPAPLVVLVLALATGCGSTVGVSSPGVAGVTGDGLSAEPGAQGLSPNGTVPGTLPGAVAGTQSGGAGPGGTSGTTGSTGYAAGGTGGTIPATTATPGVTATAVYIGLIHDSSADSVNKSVGVGAISHGDDRANYNAIIDDINRHGGVGGRKLVPVWAPFSSASTQTLDSQWAAVCQQFTHDQPRVFVADNAGSRASYRECLRRGGVGLLDSGLPALGAADLAASPNLVELGYPNLDRLARFFLQPLVEQRYFTPWNALTGQAAPSGTPKVGILTYDDGPFRRAVDTILVPALRRMGYDPLVERITPTNGAGDVGSAAAATKAAQLAFASNGVTHVIPFEAHGELSTLFLPAARSQGYYPRYGVYTGSAFEALREANLATDQQLNGAVGFGWVPSVDLPASYNPLAGPYSNANRRYCLGVMRAHGISFDSGNAEGIALGMCADLYLLKTALDKIASRITLPGFLSAVQSLGTSYQPAGSLGARFEPGHQDPSYHAYFWRYFNDCTCFHYTGRLLTIP